MHACAQRTQYTSHSTTRTQHTVMHNKHNLHARSRIHCSGGKRYQFGDDKRQCMHRRLAARGGGSHAKNKWNTNPMYAHCSALDVFVHMHVSGGEGGGGHHL